MEDNKMQHTLTHKVVDKFISPQDDVLFKKIFGEKKNEHLLKDLLSGILKINKNIFNDIIFMNTEQNPDNKRNLKTICDVKLELASGEVILVEMQKANHTYLSERMMFYNSQAFVNAAKKKEKKDEKSGKISIYSTLPKTITIVFIDEPFFKDKLNCYHDIFSMRSLKTGREFTGIQEIHVIELSKIPFGIYPWYDFMKGNSMEELNMAAEQNPVINDAIKVVEDFHADDVAMHLALTRKLAIMDEAQRLDDREAKGRAEGISQGISESQNKIAKNLLKVGIDTEIISETTGLSLEEIKAIDAGE